jgi:hypothetical protein
VPAKGLPFKLSNRARGSRTIAHRPRRPKRLLCRATPFGISQDIGRWSAAQVPIFFRRPQSSNLLPLPCAFSATCTLRGEVRSWYPVPSEFALNNHGNPTTAQVKDNTCFWRERRMRMTLTLSVTVALDKDTCALCAAFEWPCRKSFAFFLQKF